MPHTLRFRRRPSIEGLESCLEVVRTTAEELFKDVCSGNRTKNLCQARSQIIGTKPTTRKKTLHPQLLMTEAPVTGNTINPKRLPVENNATAVARCLSVNQEAI